MAKPINMPKLSDEMAEGRIAAWLKQPGEEVQAGEVVAQVETEKATLDIEAFEGGTLIGIVAAAGDTVPVGSPIAWLGKSGEKLPPATARPKPVAPAPAPGPSSRLSPSTSVPVPVPGPPTTAATRPSPARVIASPAARKAARERGIDLSAALGSGPAGRIVLADLDRAPAPSAPAKRKRELPPRQLLRELEIPLSPMRKAIARNLAVAKPGTPHFYVETSADMRRAVALRAELDELGQGTVSLNDLVLKAVAEALLRHPEVNAAFLEDRIVRRGAVHLGMAVAVDEGLITPVIRDADKKTIFELARLSKELATRARERRLKPGEYQGGTFTVSNLGMFGIEAFQAILNPPEAGILAVGVVQKIPWVDESGAIVAMERCRLTLSGDHRAIDGAVGARFLRTLRAILEAPVRLVLP
jgi:pyruvate dehydrogenase E2 component (dihydrolipoamide acetyltransferase)